MDPSHPQLPLPPATSTSLERPAAGSSAGETALRGLSAAEQALVDGPAEEGAAVHRAGARPRRSTATSTTRPAAVDPRAQSDLARAAQPARIRAAERTGPTTAISPA